MTFKKALGWLILVGILGAFGAALIDAFGFIGVLAVAGVIGASLTLMALIFAAVLLINGDL